MEIRKIRVNELDHLKELFDHINFEEYKKNLYKDILNHVRDIYVAIYNDKIIGEITVYYKTKSDIESKDRIRVYFSAFRILEDFQNLKLGQDLLQYVILDLQNKGYIEFTIGVEDDNEIGKHIYMKFGFNNVIARLSESYKGKKYEYNLLLKK